jgi:Ca2+-transporting ATPase
VAAVEEGRGIYDNIRKFVNYLLSCNIGEVLVVFVGSLIGLPLPLLAAHLLWVNLVTDGLPAIALGVDPVSPDAMKRPPRKLSDRIMSPGMSLNVFSLGAIIAFAVLLVYWLAQPFGVTVARTLAFTTLVMMEIVRIEMIRRAYATDVFSNKWLNGAVLISIMLQLAVLYTPLNIFMDVTPLTFLQWAYVGVALVVVWLLGTVTTSLIKRATKEMY